MRGNDQSHNKRMQQISTERVQDQTQLVGEGEPLRIEQEFRIWPKKKMLYAQARIHTGKKMYKLR